MNKEIYNKNNYDHDYFHGSQESLDKSYLRGLYLDMVEEGIASILDREKVFKQIDEGKTRILISESKEDIDGQIRKVFLELE